MIINHDVYRPLYQDEDHFIILVTGGRGSGKSHAVSTFIERLTFEKKVDDVGESHSHQMLYTRYTMVSAGISVIPEFMEKVEKDGTARFFHSTKSDVINKRTGARVMFRGIHTSSGNQTAKLKSIHGLTTFVVDEAEEWVSEREFETIMYSIRQRGIRNRIIIIMNPSDVNHFVYRKYIKDTHRTIMVDGMPVEISTHPNVLHIHTSYLDNKENLSEDFLRDAELMKQTNPQRYGHIFCGQWASVSEGAIFKNVGVVDSFPEECQQVAIGGDWGYENDPTAFVRCGIIGNRLYMDELCYKTHMGIGDIIREARPWGLQIYGDSADPRLINELVLGGLVVYGAVKGPGSVLAGIQKMQEYELYITRRSVNLQEEFGKYVWMKDENDNFTNTPIDAYNHCMDAIRYYITGKLLGRCAKRLDTSNISIF